MVPQFEHLAATRRVILLDLPGQGGSDPAPAGFAFADCAAAIGGVLDATGIELAVVCGHSFGGRLAVEVAAAYPGRIAGAALLDPVLLFPAVVREGATMLAAALDSDGWRTALENYFSALLSPFDPPEVRSKVLGELPEIPRVLAAQVMRAGMSGDGSEALAQVRCPILVIRRHETPHDLQRLHALQPEAWVGQVVGTGHWMTLSAPDQVNAMLDRFLESGVSASARSMV
ncbi:MAG TPA: alpha/beta hydrolase [Actinomycetota bacterium]|nr:alpha/beta hydrolase [Actinomycetota bacterium]